MSKSRDSAVLNIEPRLHHTSAHEKKGVELIIQKIESTKLTKDLVHLLTMSPRIDNCDVLKDVLDLHIETKKHMMHLPRTIALDLSRLACYGLMLGSLLALSKEDFTTIYPYLSGGAIGLFATGFDRHQRDLDILVSAKTQVLKLESTLKSFQNLPSLSEANRLTLHSAPPTSVITVNSAIEEVDQKATVPTLK